LRAIANESPYSSLPIITRNALSKRVWMRFSRGSLSGTNGRGPEPIQRKLRRASVVEHVGEIQGCAALH